MKICWNGEAVEAVIAKLTSAIESAEQQLSKASDIMALLEECDPDGENRAMQKAKQKFSDEAARLKKLAARLQDTLDATKRAYMLFEDTESENARMWDAAEAGRRFEKDGGSAAYSPAGTNGNYSFIPMTSVRRRAFPMPAWLENMASSPLDISELVDAPFEGLPA